MPRGTPIGPTGLGPESEETVYTIGLGSAVILRLSAYSVLSCFLAAGVFSGIAGGGGPGPVSAGWTQPVLYVAIYFVTVIAHELVHGLFFGIFGGHPRYGAGFKYLLPYFYAASPGDAFPLRRMLVIGLAPLVTLSGLSLIAAFLVPAWAGYFAVAFIGNTAGAVGDIWMVNRLCRFLPVQDATVVDTPTGMDVHSPDAKAVAIADRLAALDLRPPTFAVRWIGAALAVLSVEILAATIGPIFTDSLLIGPAQLPLMEFARTAEGIAWTFNVASPLAAGLVFAIAARLFSRHASVQGAPAPPGGTSAQGE